MLRKYYLLLVFALPFFAHSQTAIPFPSQDATWLYGIYDDFGNLYGYHSFYLNGDSTYQGETWAVLYHENSPEGLIRQDTTQKVWIIPNGLTTPEFLYDFGAVAGDTIQGIRTFDFFNPRLDTVVVQSVSAATPREWYLESISAHAAGFGYSWTEGVGDYSWLPASSPINLVSGTTYLICFSNMAYTSPGNPCLVANDEAMSRRLKVHPNPSNGKFRLEFDQPLMLESMQVIDAQGKVVRSYDEFRETIDLSGLEAGIYFLSVQSADNLLSRKLILQ